MTRLSSDIQLVQQALSQVMGNGFMMILQTITSLIVLLYLQPLIGVLVVVIIPLVMLSYSVMGKRFQQASADSQRLAGETATSIQENISAHAVIKAFGLENSVIAAFHTRLMAQLKAAVRLEVIAALFQNSLLFASLVEQSNHYRGVDGGLERVARSTHTCFPARHHHRDHPDRLWFAGAYCGVAQ